MSRVSAYESMAAGISTNETTGRMIGFIDKAGRISSNRANALAELWRESVDPAVSGHIQMPLRSNDSGKMPQTLHRWL